MKQGSFTECWKQRQPGGEAAVDAPRPLVGEDEALVELSSMNNARNNLKGLFGYFQPQRKKKDNRSQQFSGREKLVKELKSCLSSVFSNKNWVCLVE